MPDLEFAKRLTLFGLRPRHLGVLRDRAQRKRDVGRDVRSKCNRVAARKCRKKVKKISSGPIRMKARKIA